MAGYVWRVDIELTDGQWATVRRYLSRSGAVGRARSIDAQHLRKAHGLRTRVVRSEPVVFRETA